MHMKYVIVTLLLAASTGPGLAAEAPTVPLHSATEAGAAFDAMLKQGEAAVAAACSRIVPPGSGDDTSARFVVGGLAFHAGRPGAKREGRMVAAVLVKSLSAATNSDVRAFFLEQVRLCGGPEVVEPVSAFLTDEALCHPAVAVLQSVGGREAEAALLAGLRRTTNATAASMALALGGLRSRRAVEELTRRAQDSLPAVREAAEVALARIGDKTSGALLQQCADGGKDRSGSLLWLVWARRRLEDGDRGRCEEVCSSLLAAPAGQLRSQALNLLADSESGLALQALLAALADPDPAVASVATGRLATMRGRSVGREVLARLKDAAPARRPSLIGVLGRRGDEGALPAIAAELRHAEDPVRFAAIEACGHIGGAEAAGLLLCSLTNASPSAVEIIVHSVATMKGKGIGEAVAAGMARVPASEKVTRVRILALRRAVDQTRAVADLAADRDPSVRLAAVQALGDVGGESEIGVVLSQALAETDETARTKLLAAVAKMARRVADGPRRMDPFQRVLAGADVGRKLAVLKLLPEVGGSAACELVASLARGAAEPEAREAAVRALVDWSDAAAVDPLLAMAGSMSDMRQRILAIRSVTRLARLKDLSAKDSVAIFRRLLPLASRVEEQNQILGALAQVHSREALLLAAGYLEKPEVREAAAIAVARIAAPPRGKRSVATSADVGILNQAASVLGSGEWAEALKKTALMIGGRK
jgi:HEAT repeat protein